MMTSRRAILRGATALALAIAFVGSTALTPGVSAAPIDSLADSAGDLHTVAAKPKAPDKPDNNAGQSGESGLSDIPIIGDVVGQFKDAEPEEIVHATLDLAGVAADTAIPLIRSLFK